MAMVMLVMIRRGKMSCKMCGSGEKLVVMMRWVREVLVMIWVLDIGDAKEYW